MARKRKNLIDDFFGTNEETEEMEEVQQEQDIPVENPETVVEEEIKEEPVVEEVVEEKPVEEEVVEEKPEEPVVKEEPVVEPKPEKKITERMKRRLGIR